MDAFCIFIVNHIDFSTIVINLKVEALRINQTFIRYVLKKIDTKNHEEFENCSMRIATLPPRRLINLIYTKSMPFIMIVVSVQMGILLDLQVLKELVRRPVALGIGFICQYFIMPMIGFVISKVFRYPTLYGFGLFVVGCCPGGTASNQLTVIFNGDLALSALMTFTSTIASFFMMPLWFYTLGNYAYLRQLKIRIPFWDLIQSLATIVGPLLLGLIVAYCIPKVKCYVTLMVKPVFFLLFFYFFGFGTYVNFYLFTYIDWRMALTAPLLPWLGYLMAGILAYLFRQDWIRIKTIAIETGMHIDHS
ncbi:unnamed protein product [Rotaria magnacalcarata]|uniref:Solute carrier family 10 member 6 n=1 Tax=Rotaria magnacalcarata TaxID=392030 RepID=A0A819Q4I9_9BILA|nr:unnamed protein product [Rotaria magnacalcarata]CAF4024389.1 unnamed protein product [Rotaria magnacalcarata]